MTTLYNCDDLMELATKLVDKIAEQEQLDLAEGDERLDNLAERVVADYIETSARFSLVLTVQEAHQAMGEAIARDEARRGRSVGERVEAP